MDEITLINILNKFTELEPGIKWQLECKGDQVTEDPIMEVRFYLHENRRKSGFICFNLNTGFILEGQYQSMMPFKNDIHLTQALLDILYYKRSTTVASLN